MYSGSSLLAKRFDSARRSVRLSPTGFADIGYDAVVASLLTRAGYSVVPARTEHGRPTFRAYSPAAHLALSEVTA